MQKNIVDEPYLPRIAEQTLARKLASSGCVLISGPKFCGKSRLASCYAASSVELTDEGSIALAKADPRALLPGDSPRLIDEWQKVPVLWDLIRSDLDHGYRFGKYILTGSATPSDPSIIQHSGAGRISTMILRPLSLYESRESLGAVSLSSLFSANPEFTIVPPGENPMTLSRMAFLICRGGWPLSVLADESAALEVTEGYYEGLFRQTAGGDETSARLANGGRSRLLLVLKELARNTREMARLRKAIDTANSCKHRDACPVLHRLRDQPKDGTADPDGTGGADGQPADGGGAPDVDSASPPGHGADGDSGGTPG